MLWTKLVDQAAERLPEAIVAVAAASLTVAAWVGSIEYRLENRAPASVAQDVSHMRDTLDKLEPVITQAATDVAILKSRSNDDRELHKDTEQRMRDLERKP